MLKKLLFSVMSVLLLCFTLFSCKGDPGAAGDKGTTGPAGDSLVVMAFQNGVYPSDGYTGTSDTFLTINYDSNNYGMCTHFGAANTDCTSQHKQARGLLKFDVSSIVPSNVTVKKAYLELNIVDLAIPIGIVIYELTKNFNEGGVCNEQGVASWVSATASTTWITPGGDYNPTPISNIFNFSSVPASSIITLELNASVVQKWINNPSENYGMIIISYPEIGTGNCKGVLFASSESSILSARPKLVVYYSLP